jgi:hypothetical protein
MWLITIFGYCGAFIRTMRILISIILLCSLTNCSKKNEFTDSETKTVDSVANENKEFKEYLLTLDKVELPLTIKGCDNAYADKRVLDKGKDVKASDDNSYFKTYHHPYGQIATNGNFSAIITFGLADCLIPELITFDSNGVQIDRKTIAIGYCGSDCGYSCKEFMKIDRSFVLYTSDTIKSFDCDSLGNKLPETEENYVIYRQGKLLPSGKIELSEELKKELAVK